MGYNGSDIDAFQLFRFASDDGLLTGDKSINKNYSGSGVGTKEYYIEAQPGEQILVYRLLVHVVDSGSFDSGSYGNGITLANGIEFFFETGGIKLKIGNGFPVKTNVDWGRYCYDVNISKYGLGNESLDARWTFAKAGAPVTLKAGDKLGVRVSDDMSGLVDQTLLFQGLHIGTPSPLFQEILT